MVAVPSTTIRRDETDQRLVIRGVDWRTYLLLNDAFDQPGVRMAYCEGALEIMTIGPKHEFYKTMIARLVELYALERDIPLEGYGSTTFRNDMVERGLEPDECYCVGHLLVDVPDLAIEVVVTHGGIDKLRIYQGLGIREVWRFEKGAFTVHRLSAGKYVRSRASKLVPGIDFELLASFAAREDQASAVRQWRDAIRATTKKRRR